MRLLGAVIAGGRSRRFGADKALADYRGQPLIGHVADRLRPQVDAILLCGRELPGWASVADRPAPDLGPLGGINAGLHHARAKGFDAVVSVPCDALALPADLVARLRTAGPAAYAADAPVVGLWPASLAEALDEHLRVSPDRSVRSAAAALGLASISLPIVNINTPEDLLALR